MRYQFIAAHSHLYPVRVLCRVMRVARSGYYAYRQRSAQPPTPAKVDLAQKVKSCFLAHRRRYGARRLRVELKTQGLALGRYRVRTLMRNLGLQAIQPKRFVPQTTDSRQTRLPSPNLLRAAAEKASAPQQVVVGDITYLPLQNGRWCYLAMWQDLYTKQIVGWAVESRMTEELVSQALRKAAHGGHLKAQMIIHTDQGSQYAATSFRALLKGYELRQSMSRKGNCYDNAQAESFFARFKAELLEGGLFADVEQARSETFSYIEGYYNRIRRHSALDYKSPLQFVKEHLQAKQERNKSETLLSENT